MKRFWALITLFVLIPSSVLSSPETIDLSTMSLEELVALKVRVEQAILAKNQSGIEIPQGVYVVGEHIPAGEYTVSIQNAASICILDVYQDEKAYYNYEYWQDTFTVSYYSKLGRIWLYDGNVIVLSGAAFFEPFVGI